MKSVFEYLDYRQFLQDFYEEQKGKDYHFSHRLISQKVGLKSSGHFTQILQGKANISITIIQRFTEFLKLKKKEAEYFQELVLYNQAKNHSDTRRHFENLMAFKKSPVRVLNPDQYEFYEKLHYSAIREILAFYPYKGNNRELAKLLDPPITPAEAEKAIKLLERLGLIEKKSDNVYERNGAVISTGYDAQSVALNNFVLNSLDYAKEALDRIPRKERNFSWLTFNVSREGYEKIQSELRLFMRKALEIARNDEKPDRVYQGHFNIIPLTKPYKKK